MTCLLPAQRTPPLLAASCKMLLLVRRWVLSPDHHLPTLQGSTRQRSRRCQEHHIQHRHIACKGHRSTFCMRYPCALQNKGLCCTRRQFVLDRRAANEAKRCVALTSSTYSTASVAVRPIKYDPQARCVRGVGPDRSPLVRRYSPPRVTSRMLLRSPGMPRLRFPGEARWRRPRVCESYGGWFHLCFYARGRRCD